MKYLVMCGIVLSTIGLSEGFESIVQVPKLRAGIERSDVDGDGAAIRECVVVQKTGEWYMEVRQQKPGDPGNSLAAYQGSLGLSQAANLRTIISNANIPAIAEFVSPDHALSTRTFEWLQATILLDGKEYKRGYFYFPRGQNEDSYADPSGERLKAWLDARSSLLPLVRWIDQLGWQTMKPSRLEPNGCENR